MEGGFLPLEESLRRMRTAAAMLVLTLIEETRVSIEPDNVELLAYAEDRHSKCILPSLEQIACLPHGIEQNDSVLRQLI